jgi:hypothetical protein
VVLGQSAKKCMKGVSAFQTWTRYIARLKSTTTFWERFTSFNSITPFSLYLYDTILFIKDKGSCRTNDKLYAHNTKPGSIISMYTNLKFITAGGRFFNNLPTYVKQIKQNSLFKRKLKQLLINGCRYSVEDFIRDYYT